MMTSHWSAERVRELRTRLGLTQTAFAAELRRIFPPLGVTQIAVSRWENGRVTPNATAGYALDQLDKEFSGTSDLSHLL